MINIVGAGMAGLLAAHMLRRFEPVVWEAQASLPDNHGALLRFRTDAVARATGQNFKKVYVQKAVKVGERLYDSCSLRESNQYARKVTGEIMQRSVLNLAGGERYIAPPDFMANLARGVGIEYGRALRTEDFVEDCARPIVSTIPMPVLMKLSGDYDMVDFPHASITAFTSHIFKPATSIYQTIYYPGPEQYYRASITGDRLIIEYMGMPQDGDGWSDLERVMADFGIECCEVTDTHTKFQPWGKLMPIDEDLRRSFIMSMSDRYNIYSVGRFATWRQLLLDDVVRDVELVSRWIEGRTEYNRKLHR